MLIDIPDFAFKNRPIPNKTKSSNRVAVAVVPASASRNLQAVFYFGSEVMDAAGWEVGQTRIQFSEGDGVIAFGTKCGQWKLSPRSAGRQATICVAANQFSGADQRFGIKPLAFTVEKHRGSKVVVVKRRGLFTPPRAKAQ